MTDDWGLTEAQHIWMADHWPDICIAEHMEGADWFQRLAQTTGYRMAFGDMSIDEAIDRYECYLEGGDDEK